MDTRIQELIESRTQKVLKLDIGCGANKQGPDWIGIDFQPLSGVDIVHNIQVYPWPLPDHCIDLAVASHVAEHISPISIEGSPQTGYTVTNFGFIHWMNEIWRVMKPEGKLMLALPHGRSDGYIQDPTHCNPCNENTWRYFDPLDESGFYRFYRPRPWKLHRDKLAYDANGFMEVVLEARRMDPSYEGAQ